MNKENLKIGIYTEDEIFNYMTEQEGGMLGRSMYDAIFDKIHKLITENQQLKEQQKEFIDYLEKEIVDSRAGSSQYYSAMQHLKLFKEIIGSDK